MEDLDALLNPRNAEYVAAHIGQPPIIEEDEDPDGTDTPIYEDDIPNSKIKLRGFTDFASVRKDLHTKVLGTLATSYPKENERYALKLSELTHDDKDYDSHAQKKALQSGKSLTTKVKGTWELINKADNTVVDKVKATVANIPYLTDRGTFVRNGSDVSIVNQMRLKPGVYTRQKASGEMEAHVNVKQGTGRGFKLLLEPQTGVFKVNMGQNNWKLYPLLNAMGVTDEDLEASWGKDILAVNKKANDPRVVQKAYNALVNPKDKKDVASQPSYENLGIALKNVFERAEVDPYVTKATLGVKANRLSLPLLTRASQKVLNISKGIEETDSRDALNYQIFMSPDDLMSERITKDSGKLGSTLLWKATYGGNLKNVKPGMLDDHFESLFNGSGLSQNLEEINPLDPLDQGERVVILGEGGVGDLSMVPDEAREVQSSHFMFIDPVRSPESMKIGVDSRFTRNAMKGSNGALYTRVMDPKTNKRAFITPQIAARSSIAFPGEMETGKRFVRAMINGTKVGIVPRESVSFSGENMQDMFSTSSNLSPMASSIKAGRLLMAGKFSAQALPLRDAEAPLVQVSSGKLGDESVESQLGERLGAIRSKKEGIIDSVGSDYIVMTHSDNTQSKVPLYDNFSFNRKTYIANTPSVKPGDVVKAGDLLAKSNYTDDKGVAALGKNLRVAYISYNGLNYDDGQVISEAAAQKLSSEHTYNHNVDKYKGTDFNKGKYVGLFPKRYNKEQIEKIDDEGVIRQGSIVKTGDPLTLSVKATKPVNSLLRNNRKTYNSDNSMTWDHHSEGIVTDVYNTRSGVNVVVKAYSPAEVGDKLSGRHADKGVISAIIPNDKMPHDENGVPYEMLASPLGVTSRVNPAQLVETWLGKVARKTGKSYSMPASMSDSYIKYAKDELAKADISPTETVTDPVTGAKLESIHAGDRFIMKLHHTAEAKQSARSTDAYTSEQLPARGGKTGAKRFCFAPRQKIKTIDGEVAISSIVENKLTTSVWSYDWKKGSFCYKPVTDWHTRRVHVRELIEIEVNNAPSEDSESYSASRIMYVTREHALYRIDGIKVAAGDVQLGDVLATWWPLHSDTGTYSCAPCHVKSISAYKHDEPGVTEINVYDLTVDDTHVYTASGVIVSNSNMEIGALISHGASEVLRDAKLVRGQRNDEFWQEFKLGRDPAPKGVPFIYNKFLESLKASGINVTKTNDSVNIFAMTNKNVDDLVMTEITNADTLDQKNREPVPGGLFDIPATGGVDGNKWGYIKLDTPMPNPTMEEPLRSILDMTKKQYYDVISGKVAVNNKKGGEALQTLLERVNVDKTLSQTREAIKTAPASTKDKYIKKYKYLKAMKEKETKPTDFLLTKLPVLPPAFRPVSQLPNGTSLVADVNYLYKDLLETRNDIRELKSKLPDESLYDENLKMYNSFKAVTGAGDPVNKETKDSNVKGILKGIFGSSPKLGSFQRRTLGMSLDVVGRGVIVPNPKFNMDEVGLPINQAWEIYKPFIIRDLVKAGTPAGEATKAVDTKSSMALQSLQRVVSTRPLIINRAPTLHKYGLMAAWPKLVKGDVLQVSPQTTTGFGSDFDGNCCDFDSVINLTVSESALDKCGFSNYNAVSYKSLTAEDEVMQSGSTLVSTKVEKQIQLSMKIGEFPKCGTPVKDKNGADVYQVPEGIKVSSFDVTTGEHVWKNVKNYTVEQDCPCVEVTVGSNKVIVSDNESLAVFNPEDGLLAKMAPKDSKDKYIAVLRKQPIPFGSHGDRDLGWWLGSFVSDGWLSGRTIGYSKLEDVKREEFVRIMREQFTQNFVVKTYTGKPGKNKLGRSTKIHCNGIDLADIVRDMDITDTGTADNRQCLLKRIPTDLIEAGSEDFLWGILSGMLDGDGSVVCNTALAKPRYNARFATSSPSLRDSVKALCFRLGIRCGVTTSPPRGFSKEAYTLSISTLDLFPNLSKLSCVGERELTIISAWKGSPPDTKKSKDTVPLTFEEATRLAVYARSINDGNTYSTLKKDPKTPRCGLSTVLTMVDSGYPDIQGICGRAFGDVIWERISSITDAGRREVFDLEVEDTKVFVVNTGIVIWDTMQYHVPVSDKAVKEAVEKMMPSKNLLSNDDFTPHYIPRMEFLQGLHLASRRESKKSARVFDSVDSAIKAYKRGEVSLDDNIKIQGSNKG